MTESLKKLCSHVKKWSCEEWFSFLYPAAVYCCLCVLAFSVSTLFDKIVAGAMVLSFLWLLCKRLRRKKAETLAVLKNIFCSARIFYLAFFVYLIWDILLLLWTKDGFLALRKLPYYLSYLFLFAGGVWYCRDRDRLRRLLLVVASAGSSVAVCSYFLHFFLRKPYYFQRMSTCRDYNVYATLLFVSLVFAVVLIMNVLRAAYWKRLLLLLAVLAVNLPAFYLAGSRRMIVLLPFFYGFSLFYEGLRLVRTPKKLVQNLSMLLLCGLVYLSSTALAEPFAAYAEQKREDYNVWVLSQESVEKPGEGGDFTQSPQESTISDVLETIENGSMTNKRKLIYASGLGELSTYSPLEWAFGRGAAYDLYYYSHTTDETLLSAYGYSVENRPAVGWMSAHNFLLADVLNGGLLKLTLGLFLVIIVLVQAGRVCRQNPEAGLLVVIGVAVTICNACISGAYGLLNDIFFMVLLGVLGGILRLKATSVKANADDAKMEKSESSASK